MLTRWGVRIEEMSQKMGQTYLAEPDADGDEAGTLRPLKAAAEPCGPRQGMAGQPPPRGRAREVGPDVDT